MLQRRHELEGFIKNRISEDSMRLVCDLVREMVDENAERLISMNENAEDLLRRQGRVQGARDVLRCLEGIHMESRIGGTRNN